MHVIHHTDAFILKKQPTGEANVRVWLFTKEFGLIVAVVQGVRKGGAKLQMHLSEYALVSADLVKGRDVWRLINVSVIHNPFDGKKQKGFGRPYVRALAAVDRFCQGESAHPELFAHLFSCMETLAHDDIDERSLDTVAVWKIMESLGYVALEEKDRQLATLSFVDAVKSIDHSTRSRLIAMTNSVIAQTHL